MNTLYYKTAEIAREQAEKFMLSDIYISEAALKDALPKDSYLKKLPAVKALENRPIAFEKRVTFLVGENGSGKSTLIEGIAAAFGFNPEGGSLNFMFETAATHSELYKHLRLSKFLRPKDGFFLRAESFYNAASYIDELDRIAAPSPKISDSYGGRSLHTMSHGEAFLQLVKNRFSGGGLYILDEPEAALSPMRTMALLCEIDRLSDLGSQFIIATHSPILMSLPGSQLLWLDDGGIRPIDWRETEHYAIMREFILRPERMLKELGVGK